ncbi:hypothetical protein ['Cynodon dactylon' phytoplasma]|uniref:hypothetical protein n=1 Tax='Cynodon dactylon' phytoplasma TaxID=295320 RepID=UPI001265C0C4|nr:hypothetical protein ['Cynodon dactylon' phytoplasma]KAB8121806.1 hypothetical protein F1741_01600 ['Cynodon dactylon' phytoplasma]
MKKNIKNIVYYLTIFIFIINFIMKFNGNKFFIDYNFYGDYNSSAIITKKLSATNCLNLKKGDKIIDVKRKETFIVDDNNKDDKYISTIVRYIDENKKPSLKSEKIEYSSINYKIIFEIFYIFPYIIFFALSLAFFCFFLIHKEDNKIIINSPKNSKDYPLFFLNIILFLHLAVNTMSLNGNDLIMVIYSIICFHVYKNPTKDIVHKYGFVICSLFNTFYMKLYFGIVATILILFLFTLIYSICYKIKSYQGT